MATRSITKQRTDALLAAAQERAPQIEWSTITTRGCRSSSRRRARRFRSRGREGGRSGAGRGRHGAQVGPACSISIGTDRRCSPSSSSRSNANSTASGLIRLPCRNRSKTARPLVQNSDLAVDEAGFDLEGVQGRDYRRIAFGPVVAVACQQSAADTAAQPAEMAALLHGVTLLHGHPV